jgi:hypothetical protein
MVREIQDGWHDKWLNGVAPIDIAPNLYEKAHFKKRMVVRELLNKSWMYAACHISSREDLLEFINLWALVKNVNLSGEEHDSILWKWMAIGEYSTATAYRIQFQRSHAPFKIGQLWKTKVEPKVKVFI